VDKQYLEYVESIRESAKIIVPTIRKYKLNGRMLDIGCATGEFLEVARTYGYEVEGLELSRWSSLLAKKKGLRIFRETLKTFSKKNPARYDIITLFGVIEHFEFPDEEMGYISKLIKPGGLLIMWTGDVASLPSKILGKSWWYWQGQHIQYFTNKSLTLLCKNHRIRHLKTKTYPFVATHGLLDNSLNRYKLKSLFMILASVMFRVKRYWTFHIPGEMLWFGVKSKK
jgi:2-polyprenyl-3-methyl-5-hydroxy-6-metoxy-1,4-benzoquinol methylase